MSLGLIHSGNDAWYSHSHGAHMCSPWLHPRGFPHLRRQLLDTLAVHGLKHPKQGGVRGLSTVPVVPSWVSSSCSLGTASLCLMPERSESASESCVFCSNSICKSRVLTAGSICISLLTSVDTHGSSLTIDIAAPGQASSKICASVSLSLA